MASVSVTELDDEDDEEEEGAGATSASDGVELWLTVVGSLSIGGMAAGGALTSFRGARMPRLLLASCSCHSSRCLVHKSHTTSTDVGCYCVRKAWVSGDKWEKSKNGTKEIEGRGGEIK